MGLWKWLFGNRSHQQTGAVERPPGKGQIQSLFSPDATGRFGKDRHKPVGKWVQTTTMVKVAGTQHRKSDVRKFTDAVRKAEREGKPYGIRLEPDPSNRHDPNAIAVFGHTGGSEWNIGFLDRDTASEITRDLVSKGIPIAGELYEVWVGDSGFTDFKILVLAPPGNSMKKRLGH